MQKVPTKFQKGRGGGGTGSKAGGRITGTGSVPKGGSETVVRTSVRARVPSLSQSESDEDGEDGEDGAVRNLASAMDDAADRDGAQAMLQLANQGADHFAVSVANKRGRKTGPEAHEAAKWGTFAISPPHKILNAGHAKCACAGR